MNMFKKALVQCLLNLEPHVQSERSYSQVPCCLDLFLLDSIWISSALFIHGAYYNALLLEL